MYKELVSAEKVETLFPQMRALYTCTPITTDERYLSFTGNNISFHEPHL